VHRLIPPLLMQLLRLLWATWAKSIARPRLRSARRLHLGSGAKLLDGWANLDREGPPGVIRLDLARRLPVADEAIDLIYSEHFIEHLPPERGAFVLAECFRVLRPGGRLRISTPDLEAISRQYLTGATGDWSDVDWSPATPCAMLNELHRSWGHEYIYDFAEIERALRAAGFVDIERMPRHESTEPQLRGLETRPFHGDLIVEAGKPRR
jgi:predicted SAM-dependent methyltransferase